MNVSRILKRSISTMSASPASMSPFTSAVVSAMRKLFPEVLADKSFDNTGLLLEAPHRCHLNNSVLLTVDLTQAVADEAIARKDSIIITYHPIIFRALKSMTLGNTQQNSLLRLAQEGISVYSPHTAVDAAPNGVNEWLADIVAGTDLKPGFSTFDRDERERQPPIIPIQDPPAGFEGSGYGRIVRFKSPERFGDLLKRISRGLDDLPLSVAVPQSIPRWEKDDIQISSVGICAGSGGSLLNNLDVDLLFTGELSHHEALAATEQGRCVVTAFHSNTERRFLEYMTPMLWNELHDASSSDSKLREFLSWTSKKIGVQVSQVDRDPFEILTADEIRD